MTIRTYLVNLTSRRAAQLFVLSFVVGVFCIVNNAALPWSPAVIVAVYGLILFYTQKVYLVSHAEMTNNSPYFLGFLFFLVALARTFLVMSFTGADFQFERMMHQLGGAFLATIVGLPFRQLLFAYSPSQAEQDLFFRTLEEELRRSATEFKRSQAELVKLLQEFAEVRKSLFSEEEKASRRYVRALEKATGLFDEGLENYPHVISSALASCGQSLEVLKEKCQQLSDAARSVDPQQIVSLAKQFGTVKENSADLSLGLTALHTAVKHLETVSAAIPGKVETQLLSAQTMFDDMTRVMKQRISAIDSDIQQVDKVLTDFINVARDRVESLR